MSSASVCISATELTRTYTRYAVREKGLPLIRRIFRDRQLIPALQGASFEISSGEIVGLLGPNGAGKSTTVKLLCGILTPTSGTCTVQGFVPSKDRKEYVKSIGAVFGQRTQLWWDVPIRDSFSLLRDIYGADRHAWKAREEELTDALELSSFMNAPLRQLSLGQKMRAEVCAALLHRPSLLFLDEPTIGLDSPSKVKLRSFLRQENEQYGTTILLTTHDMEDMTALCPRVLVLGRGHLLADTTLDALFARYGKYQRLHCRIPETLSLPDALLELQHAGSIRMSRQGELLDLIFDPHLVSAQRILELLLRAGSMEGITLSQEDADALVSRMYREMKLI